MVEPDAVCETCGRESAARLAAQITTLLGEREKLLGERLGLIQELARSLSFLAEAQSQIERTYWYQCLKAYIEMIYAAPEKIR
jgi:hypothetical protein